MVGTLIVALIGLAAVVYTHRTLGRFVAGHSRTVAARVAVLAIALGFGFVVANLYAAGIPPWLTFMAGFGMVHIPPAMVLLIKRARHSPKS